MYSRYISGILWRRYQSNLSTSDTANKLHHFSQSYAKSHGKFKLCGRRMSEWLRDQTIQMVKLCARQFEFVAAQRIRRGVQIVHLYTRMWDEMALREFMRAWRRRVARNTKDFLIGAVGVTVYNWEQERIQDGDMYCYSREIDGIQKLLEATTTCSECNMRLIVDANQPGVEYCKCQLIKSAAAKAQQEGIEWEPFIERKDMLVWRRMEKEFKGLYSYKVYGCFDDVSAEDFLQVQIDISYRKEWDDTAKELKIIDTDPVVRESQKSDIVYWEMVWPRMFANRDYVYQRKWIYDESKGIIVIACKVTDHPHAPNRPDTYRVTSYWSYMVIKPRTGLKEPGIEFVLTYFDDPGVNIPSALTAWIAMSGFPDYLYRMRQASKEYKSFKALREPESAIVRSEIATSDDRDSRNANGKEEDETSEEEANEVAGDERDNETKGEDAEDEKSAVSSSPSAMDDDDDEGKKDGEETSAEESTEEEEESSGFLDYFFFGKLFA